MCSYATVSLAKNMKVLCDFLYYKGTVNAHLNVNLRMQIVRPYEL